MKHNRFALKNRRRGAALVEAAICFPVFFVLICIILQIGHLYFVKNQVAIVAREAARYGSTDNVTTSDVLGMIVERLSPLLLNETVSEVTFNSDESIAGLSWPGKDMMDSEDEVAAHQLELIGKINEHMTLMVRDASIYDTGGPYPGSESEILDLPTIELNGLDPREMFVVRAEVNYNTPFNVPGLSQDGLTFSSNTLLQDGMNLSSYSFMRHE